jgi:hypothetical protein
MVEGNPEESAAKWGRLAGPVRVVGWDVCPFEGVDREIRGHSGRRSKEGQLSMWGRKCDGQKEEKWAYGRGGGWGVSYFVESRGKHTGWPVGSWIVLLWWCVWEENGTIGVGN